MSDDKNKEQNGGSERDIKPPNTGKPRKTEPGGSRGIEPPKPLGVRQHKTEPGGSRGIEPPKLLGAIPPWLDKND